MEGISIVIFIINLLNNSMNSLKLFSPNNFLYLSKINLSIPIDFLAMLFLLSPSNIGNNLIISFITKINLPIW